MIFIHFWVLNWKIETIFLCDIFYILNNRLLCNFPLYILIENIPLASGDRPPSQALTLIGGVGFIAQHLRRPF